MDNILSTSTTIQQTDRQTFHQKDLTIQQTGHPSDHPSNRWIIQQTDHPTGRSSYRQSILETEYPTERPPNRPPIQQTDHPTDWPSNRLIIKPTDHQTDKPSNRLTIQQPSHPTNQLSNRLTYRCKELQSKLKYILGGGGGSNLCRWMPNRNNLPKLYRSIKWPHGGPQYGHGVHGWDWACWRWGEVLIVTKHNLNTADVSR